MSWRPCPTGTERSLIQVDDWDLRWQNIYLLREPLYLPAGSRIDAWFTYDNSEDNPDNPHVPPKPVQWGWKSEEEMAELWMTVVPDDWDQRGHLYRRILPKAGCVPRIESRVGSVRSLFLKGEPTVKRLASQFAIISGCLIAMTACSYTPGPVLLP